MEKRLLSFAILAVTALALCAPAGGKVLEFCLYEVMEPNAPDEPECVR